MVSVRVRRAGTEHTAFPTLLLFTGVFTKLLPRNGIRFPLPQILQEKPVCLISSLILDFSCQKLIPFTVTTAYDKNHTTWMVPNKGHSIVTPFDACLCFPAREYSHNTYLLGKFYEDNTWHCILTSLDHSLICFVNYYRSLVFQHKEGKRGPDN